MCIGLSICTGESMKPSLPKHCLVVEIKRRLYKIGDIVVFKSNDGKIYCHRIVESDGQIMTTKGDNRRFSEEHEVNIPVKNILGKVVFHIP